MVEALLLLAIAAVGTGFAVYRSRRRVLTGRYTRFAIFEHIVLPWLLFICLGATGYALNSIPGFNMEGLVMFATVLVWIGLPGMIIVFPPAGFLLLILFALAYLSFPMESHIAILFTLKVMWSLLGAAAFGSTIGFFLGRRLKGIER